MRDLTRDPSQFYVRETVQTFLDNVIVHSAPNVARRWYQPQRHSAGALIQKDRPWEHIPYFTYSNYCVIRDPQDGLYRCWYEDLVLIPRKKPADRVQHHSRQLYAESEDGIEWQKPEFDLVVDDGRKTNIVLGSGAGGAEDVHSMSVVLDPYPSSSNHRFRAVFSHTRWKNGQRHERIECAHSPDGIHWKIYDQPPRFGISEAKLDDVSVLFYDEDARQFVQNTRHFLKGPGGGGAPWGGMHYYGSDGRRRVWQTRSHDFLHWTEPVLVAAVDENDDLDEQFYGMAQFRIGMVQLATLGVFRVVANEMDVQLLMSRDGIRWNQTNKRQPFLKPRGEGHYDAHMVSMTSQPVEVGDQVRFYHGAAACHHDWWLWGPNEDMDHPEAKDSSLARYSLGLATLRKDGFAGLYANQYRDGLVATQALISEGSKVLINARCGLNGSVRVEVCNRDGKVLEPCSKENCDPFSGDSVEHTMTWKGNPDVPVKTWRKLRIFLHDAEIFSFRFTDSRDPGVWAHAIHAVSATT